MIYRMFDCGLMIIERGLQLKGHSCVCIVPLQEKDGSQLQLAMKSWGIRGLGRAPCRPHHSNALLS